MHYDLDKNFDITLTLDDGQQVTFPAEKLPMVVGKLGEASNWVLEKMRGRVRQGRADSIPPQLLAETNRIIRKCAISYPLPLPKEGYVDMAPSPLVDEIPHSLRPAGKPGPRVETCGVKHCF